MVAKRPPAKIPAEHMLLDIWTCDFFRKIFSSFCKVRMLDHKENKCTPACDLEANVSPEKITDQMLAASQSTIGTVGELTLAFEPKSLTKNMLDEKLEQVLRLSMIGIPVWEDSYFLGNLGDINSNTTSMTAQYCGSSVPTGLALAIPEEHTIDGATCSEIHFTGSSIESEDVQEGFSLTTIDKPETESNKLTDDNQLNNAGPTPSKPKRKYNNSLAPWQLPEDEKRRRRKTMHGKLSPMELMLLLSRWDVNPHLLVSPHVYGEKDGAGANQQQPFKIVVHPQVGLMADIHSRLCEAEVIGLLAGLWVEPGQTDKDDRRGTIYVQCLFPCTSTRRDDDDGSTDVELSPAAELAAREVIHGLGLCVVGWYHSHPKFRPSPSVTDIRNQQSYQQLMRLGMTSSSSSTPAFKSESSAHSSADSPDDEGDSTSPPSPFVGLIVSPYDDDTENVGDSAVMRWFHTKPFVATGAKNGLEKRSIEMKNKCELPMLLDVVWRHLDPTAPDRVAAIEAAAWRDAHVGPPASQDLSMVFRSDVVPTDAAEGGVIVLQSATAALSPPCPPQNATLDTGVAPQKVGKRGRKYSSEAPNPEPVKSLRGRRAAGKTAQELPVENVENNVQADSNSSEVIILPSSVDFALEEQDLNNIESTEAVSEDASRMASGLTMKAAVSAFYVSDTVSMHLVHAAPSKAEEGFSVPASDQSMSLSNDFPLSRTPCVMQCDIAQEVSESVLPVATSYGQPSMSAALGSGDEEELCRTTPWGLRGAGGPDLLDNSTSASIFSSVSEQRMSGRASKKPLKYSDVDMKSDSARARELREQQEQIEIQHALSRRKPGRKPLNKETDEQVENIKSFEMLVEEPLQQPVSAKVWKVKRKYKKSLNTAGAATELPSVDSDVPPPPRRNANPRSLSRRSREKVLNEQTMFSLIQCLGGGIDEKAADISQKLLLQLPPRLIALRGTSLSIVCFGFYYQHHEHRVSLLKGIPGKSRLIKLCNSARHWLPMLGLSTEEANNFMDAISELYTHLWKSDESQDVVVKSIKQSRKVVF